MIRIAMLLDQNFEDSEFRVPYDRLRAAGYRVEIVGREFGAELVGRQGRERIAIDASFHEVSAKHYDALVIPGGLSPGELTTEPDAVRLAREIGFADKPVGAIGHGTLMLIAADLAYARLLIGPPSLEAELLAAGARWLDRDVVVDGNVITARTEADLAGFTDALLHEIAEGVPTRAEPVYPFEAMEHERPGVH